MISSEICDKSARVNINFLKAWQIARARRASCLTFVGCFFFMILRQTLNYDIVSFSPPFRLFLPAVCFRYLPKINSIFCTNFNFLHSIATFCTVWINISVLSQWACWNFWIFIIRSETDEFFRTRLLVTLIHSTIWSSKKKICRTAFGPVRNETIWWSDDGSWVLWQSKRNYALVISPCFQISCKACNKLHWQRRN